MYDIIGDSAVNFCNTFNEKFPQIFDGDRITTVSSCMNDRECSNRMSFTHMNNSYCQCAMWSCEHSITVLQVRPVPIVNMRFVVALAVHFIGQKLFLLPNQQWQSTEGYC